MLEKIEQRMMEIYQKVDANDFTFEQLTKDEQNNFLD
jgi:hypothetical protein